MMDQRIYYLIQAEQNGSLTTAETQELSMCRKTDAEQVISIQRFMQQTTDLILLPKTVIDSTWDNFYSQLSNENESSTKNAASKSKFGFQRLVFSIAASLLLLAAAYFIFDQGEKQYKFAEGFESVELRDATKITLNTASSVVTSRNYGKSKREMAIHGEVFVEAAKSDIPLKLSSTHFEILVLGTAFNVMDHKEDPISTVTLYEGSLTLTLPDGEIIHMTSGNHICWNNTKNEMTQAFVTRNAPGWKEGHLTFETVLFEEVFTRIGHRFDVQFLNTSVLDGLHFKDDDKDQTLNSLLARIELATGVVITEKEKAVYQIEE